MVVTKNRKDIKDVLMNPHAKGIKEPYYLIKVNGQIIFVVSAGLNGVEFNKTGGFFSNYPGVVIYQCLYGQGILLMQRNDEMGDAKEFKVVTLSPGRQVVVPSGWGMCLVNIGKNFLVVLGNADVEAKYVDVKSLTEKRGFAYYVVEKKGEISFEQNPNYSVHPQIATE